jgi:MraZ protein
VEASGAKGDHVFIGEHKHALDPKGRIIMPAKFRSALGERFVMTKGLDKCLFVYPLDEWQALAVRLKALPITDIEIRKFIRFFFAGAFECELDKQGRALVPPNLREYAKLDKDIVITGALTRIEVWSNEAWDEHSASIDIEHPSIIDRMVGLGI